MKIIYYAFIRRLRMLLACAALSFSAILNSANTTETVEQVSGAVTLSSAVDYVITSSTPFAAGATLDITDADNAVVIFKSIRPTAATRHLANITINGQRAATASNCQLRIYADGTILLPYHDSAKSLTVYTGKGQTGESEQYGAGARVSLGGKPMDNAIRSFTLRRGYMVCFATKADGKGYSRVYIADKGTLNIDLPNILSSAVSSIRVSKWNDASKKGYAGNDVTANTMLNTTWCYNWDAGVNVWADREYVTQHHHEGWPGISDVGNNGTSANILGNNEPDNTNDDREQVNTVDEVLRTWPDMMATGRRLGSPAMSSNLTWLYNFIDSIDKRGWRCDYVVMHCYWYSDWSSWYNQLKAVHDRTRRPIWITEMNYGANWTGWPGSDRTGSAANYAIELQHMGPVVDGLEATPWLERYAIYNWVEDCRKVYDNVNGVLTPFGEYYAQTPSAVGYDSRYDYVPAIPAMRAPTDFSVKFDKSSSTAHLSWHEYNGEYNGSMTVERKISAGRWETVSEVTLQEEEADYTFDITPAENGSVYRVHVIDATGKDLYTREQMASASDFEAGDAVTDDSGATRYLGGNVFVNGDFDLGITSWSNGEGEPIGQPHFEVMSHGSIDGGTYLQAFSDMAADGAGSVKAVIDIAPGADYYFSAAVCADGLTYNRLSLTADGKTENSTVVSLGISPTWSNQAFYFNSGEYSKALLSLRRQAAMSQIDKLMLCRLYDTRAEAIADGVSALKLRAAAVNSYISSDKALAAELSEAVASATGSDEPAYLALRQAVTDVLQAYSARQAIDSLLTVAGAIEPFCLPGSDELLLAVDEAKSASTAVAVIDAHRHLADALEACLPLSVAGDVIKSPDFATSSSGWTVKSGTYTGGDQRMATIAGKKCWNAWWSGIDAAEGSAATLGIRQTVTGLTHGLYVLDCVAATEHYCLSDQHAYLVTSTDSVVSPLLSADLIDISTATSGQIWQPLSTAPVYVGDDEAVTVGFCSSKNGAIDNAWRKLGDKTSTGDKREGWWCATNFRFRYLPLLRTATDKSHWGTVCLPQAITPSKGMTLYKIAGVNATGTELCLTEVTETVPGEPYIYHSADTVSIFFQSGESVARAITDESGMRGYFNVRVKAPVGSFVLTGGEWNIVTADNRPQVSNYSSLIYNPDKLRLIESWDGVTMPIHGFTVTSVNGITADGVSAADKVFTVGGRPATSSSAAHGIYIRKGSGQTRKIVK